MDDDDEVEEEQPDEGMVGLKILFGTLAMMLPPPLVNDLKLLLTLQFRDKIFASLLTFVDVVVVVAVDDEMTLALCCSKAMAVFRVPLRSFFVVVVETRLKL